MLEHFGFQWVPPLIENALAGALKPTINTNDRIIVARMRLFIDAVATVAPKVEGPAYLTFTGS